MLTHVCLCLCVALVYSVSGAALVYSAPHELHSKMENDVTVFLTTFTARLADRFKRGDIPALTLLEAFTIIDNRVAHMAIKRRHVALYISTICTAGFNFTAYSQVDLIRSVELWMYDLLFFLFVYLFYLFYLYTTVS